MDFLRIVRIHSESLSAAAAGSGPGKCVRVRVFVCVYIGAWLQLVLDAHTAPWRIVGVWRRGGRAAAICCGRASRVLSPEEEDKWTFCSEGKLHNDSVWRGGPQRSKTNKC